MSTDEPVDPAAIIPPPEAGDYEADRAACAELVDEFINSIDESAEVDESVATYEPAEVDESVATNEPAEVEA